MKGKRHRWMLVAGFLSQLIASELAAGELPSGLQACRAERDDANRLSCYDREIDAQSRRPSKGAETPPVQQAAVPRTPEEDFGHRQVRVREDRAAEQQEDRLKELVATVIEVAKRANGTHVMTLDNGQVWMESSLEPAFRVAPGESITIKPAALGTFLLSTQSNRSTRVTRVK